MNMLQKSIAFLTAFAALSGCTNSYAIQHSTQGLSEETVSFYADWKDKYLVQNPYVTKHSEYYVWYNEDEPDSAVTVSEAHGYGMLIAACMAEYDSDAKEIFDGMYRFYEAHTSEIGPHLMAWQQADNGTAIVSVSGADSATDGDMDIAYALLLADSIWGSSGKIDYRQSAVNIINDIMTYEVNKTDWILQLGDWTYWSDENDPYYAAIRASDFIMQYMPVFADATNDNRWMNVYNSTYDIINTLIEEYGTGLLPDFIVKDQSGHFVPAPADFLESAYDGYYYYNSCRTPWRIGMDYLINGNQNAHSFANTINAFITKASDNDPWEIMAGYQPDGTPVENYNDLCFTAPFLISAACVDDSAWHDALREAIINYGDDVYYGDTIKLLCLIADDGGWLVPTDTVRVRGDVNADGVCNIADAVMLHRWLLTIDNLTDWKAGDLNENGRIDVSDLTLMKRELIQ